MRKVLQTQPALTQKDKRLSLLFDVIALDKSLRDSCNTWIQNKQYNSMSQIIHLALYELMTRDQFESLPSPTVLFPVPTLPAQTDKITINPSFYGYIGLQLGGSGTLPC